MLFRCTVPCCLCMSGRKRIGISAFPISIPWYWTSSSLTKIGGAMFWRLGMSKYRLFRTDLTFSADISLIQPVRRWLSGPLCLRLQNQLLKAIELSLKDGFVRSANRALPKTLLRLRLYMVSFITHLHATDYWFQLRILDGSVCSSVILHLLIIVWSVLY